MILYSIIFILSCWQCTGGKSVESISIESVLDQVAIPTKIIDEFFQRTGKASSRKLIGHGESTTIRYENSNGFVPLITSAQAHTFEEKRKNSTNYINNKLNETTTIKYNNVKDNRSFSIARKVSENLQKTNENRRSFKSRRNRDDFELLKVSNGTPIIATYDTFFEQSKENSKQDHLYFDGNSKKLLRNKDRERGKKIQNYMANYDTINEDDQYSYSDVDEDTKKNSYQIKQTHTENYNQKASLPRINYASMSTSTPNQNYAQHFENNENKFNNPIMVGSNDYKVDVKVSTQTTLSTTANPQSTTNDSLYPEYETSNKFSHSEGTNRNYDSADSRDFSDEYDDYMEEKERSRRLQKVRRRPTYFDTSKKLPKEHRDVHDVYDDNGRKRTNSRTKSRYRTKSKPVQVITEYHYDNEENNSDENLDDNNNQQNGGNSWSQITPNVEISHSNGFEINQIEKPKLQIVPVNIVPTFDHATAIDNSQGFDITNAMFNSFVDGSMVSTATPIVSSSSNYLKENLMASSTMKPKIEISTSVPDVIVGQSSFNNPVHAVFMPNKLQHNMLNQYLQSTVSPTVFAVTPQSTFSASPTITPNLQQMLNQMQSFPMNQQLLTAQSTQQPLTNFLQSMQSNSNNQLYLNSNEVQGQNSYQSTSRSTTERTDSHHKKKIKGNHGQFLASASLSVDQGSHRHTNKDRDHGRHNNKENNSKKKNTHHYENDDNNYNTENNYQATRQNINTYVQPTVVPAILHTGYGLINNQNQQLLQNPLFIANPQQTSQLFKATNDALENSLKQLQYNLLNNRNQFSTISGLDSVGGASNNVNAINNIVHPVQKAQLPILGAKNVEIINPNLNANAYAINQIPTAIVTTPIPIFTTTGFITTKPATFSTTTQEAPVSVKNFVNALTEIGTKKPSPEKKLNDYLFLNLQGSDRPLFNPINFVPNYDLVKSQTILNNNIAPSDIFSRQNLNLVPLVPGGNFYKHSQGAQIDLANKPKLSSDLEKYAEEMFKESLRTIYNSHKWNNDARPPSTNVSLVDNSDIAKLRNELLRIKNTLRDSKLPKDILEAHHTENKIRTVKPGSDHKRPESSIEQSHLKHKHKSRPSNHHHQRPKPQINDFLTPPKVNSFISKSPFVDRPPKKRPIHGPRPNFNHESSRPRPRQGTAAPKIKGSDAQESSLVDYKYPVRPYQDKYQYSQPDYRPLQNYNYPTFTTSSPDINQYQSPASIKFPDIGLHDINHQRTHNLMGLLMKNNQLPPGIQNNRFTDRAMINQMFDEENRRTQSQAYQDVIRSFQKESNRPFQPIPLTNNSQRVYPNTNHKK